MTVDTPATSIRNKANLTQALKVEPRPLYYHPARLLLIWSPKCACTQIVLWYFKHCGLLDAAEFYDPWPHRYRTQVLYKSQTYKHWIKAAPPRQVTAIQIGRHPARRVLSSYRHVLKWGLVDKAMSKTLRTKINHREGFSFETFMRFLERTDLSQGCDPHIRRQVHLATDVVPPRRVLLEREDLYDTLNQLEYEFGLTHTDFSEYPAFARVENKRRVTLNDSGDWQPSDVLSRHNAWSDWPVSPDGLNDDMLARIYDVYELDFRLFDLERPRAKEQLLQ